MLTVGAVAAGVIVIIFLTALFFGIRAKLTTMLTESIPHVTVKVRETEPVPLSEVGSGIGNEQQPHWETGSPVEIHR